MTKSRYSRACAVLVLLLAASAIAQAPPAFLNNKVSLTLESTPVGDVVRLLARQHNFNVALAGDVKGDVTVVLNNVTVAQALDAILPPNDLTWFVQDNVMIVKPSGTLSDNERVSMVVRLKFAAADQVKDAVQHLLSPQGKVQVMVEAQSSDGKKIAPTTLMISDRQTNLNSIIGVINGLDIAEPQLNIEVKLVETNLSDESKIGIDWPQTFQARFGKSYDENDEGSATALFSDKLGSSSWVWGTFSAATVQTALDFMLQTGNSRLLSDPNLTTISNQPAEIAVTTTYPIQTLNRFSEGAVIQDIVSFQDLDVGIVLRVTGRVADSGVISMTVNPVIEEIAGLTGPANNQRPITSKRSLTTNVRVKDGETLVMGGLLRDNKVETLKKVPLLGSIPGIGKLFQHHYSKTEKTDLTVFITPKIIRSN